MEGKRTFKLSSNSFGEGTASNILGKNIQLSTPGVTYAGTARKKLLTKRSDREMCPFGTFYRPVRKRGGLQKLSTRGQTEVLGKDKQKTHNANPNQKKSINKRGVEQPPGPQKVGCERKAIEKGGIHTGTDQ